MLENAFTHGTDLRSTDRPGNGLVEHFDFAAVSTPNQVVDLHEKLARRFIPDTRIRVRGESGEIMREGMLLKKFPNGDVELQLDLGEDFRLRGMGIDTRLAGQLALSAQGPLTELPSLRGRVRTEGGTFRAYGQQLIIQRGFIDFSGPVSNPALDIVALRPNYTSDQRVGVQVMGSALLPRVRLYSEPALPDNQTMAWLLLGRPAPDSGAEAAMLQSAALALLGGREGRGLAANFGLDELSFSGGGDGDVSSASVTLGKRLSDRLYAAYEHSLAGTGGTLLIFYELSRRWTLRGSTGANQAVDLIYRLSFD